MKYFQPKSLSFWTAIVEAGVNIVRLAGHEIPPQVDGILAAIFGIAMRQAVGKDKK